MKIDPNVFILEIPADFGAGPTFLNLALIYQPGFGATLFDTGLPGSAETILQAIEDDGIDRKELKQIVITHADSDHIGSMKALKDLTQAAILCLETEAGYVSGATPPYKMPPPKVLEENPAIKAMIDSVKRLPPDQTLKDGEEIPNALGARAIATPGHTPGHMSVYLPNEKLLITGDALVSADGVLDGPMERATPDMESARASVRKLAQLDVEQIIAYHGGLVMEDSNGQLKKLAEKISGR